MNKIKDIALNEQKVTAQLRSCASRRAKKSLQEIASLYLSEPIEEGSTQSKKEIIVRNVIEAAVKGDMTACELVLTYLSRSL